MPDTGPASYALAQRISTRHWETAHKPITPFILRLGLHANNTEWTNQECLDWIAANPIGTETPEQTEAKTKTLEQINTDDHTKQIVKKIKENRNMANTPVSQENVAKPIADQDIIAKRNALLDRMMEESLKGGMFFKMQPKDDQRIVFLSEPVEGLNEYEGKTKTQFTADIALVSAPAEKMTWAIRQKEVMDQLVAIMRNNGRSQFTGMVLDVATRGPDAMKKHWFLREVVGGAPTGAPSGSPQSGEAWLADQIKGLKAANDLVEAGKKFTEGVN